MKKNILLVDDSALMRRTMCDIINAESDFQVADSCCDGIEAYEKLKHKKYDAVLLDVNMPRMDGLELLEKLQEEHIKATVIMVSTLTTRDAKVTLRAMELGAIDFVPKPQNIIETKGAKFQSYLLEVLRAALQEKKPARVRNVRPRPTPKAAGIRRNKVVALACSTGGPKALQSVIPFLDARMDAPVLVVQHMPPGFTGTMAERLNELSPLEVKEAEDGDILQKGRVYIAPGGRHLMVKRMADGKHQVSLSDAPAIGGLRPCANLMYESLATCGFSEVTCVVLTGMGADGTLGITNLGKKVPVYVIAQDEATSVVYGMPKMIYEAGMVDTVVPLDQVAESILKNVGVN